MSFAASNAGTYRCMFNRIKYIFADFGNPSHFIPFKTSVSFIFSRICLLATAIFLLLFISWNTAMISQYALKALICSSIIGSRFPIRRSIHAIRDKVRFSSISFLKVVLHSFAQNNDLVRIFRSIFFALVDKLRAKS